MAQLYTKAYLLAEARTLLNEPTALFWTDTELNDFIDWAARTISGITLCNPVLDTISPAAGTLITDGVWATSAQDLIKVESVSITSSTGDGNVVTRLQAADIRAFGHGAGAWGASGDTNRKPLYYYVHGGESTYQPISYIFLWPPPKGIYIAAGATVNVYGYRVAEQYYRTDAGTAYEIPDRLEQKLIDFVLACAYAKAGKFSLTRLHMSTFMQNALIDRRDVYDAKRVVDSKDRFAIPDRTQQGGQ